MNNVSNRVDNSVSSSSMKFFSQENLNYLGVDIGNAGIKVVELKDENGRPRLVTYGYVNHEINMQHDLSQEEENKILSILKNILEKAQVTTNKVVVSIPSFSVFSSVISLPVMNKKDLSQAVYWQAKKIVPISLDEMTLDWKILNQPHKKDKQKSKKDDLKVLIAAAPKKLVLRYVNLFKAAGLDLVSLETENFALQRSLVGTDDEAVMVVDIGSITSDIAIIDNQIPVLNRSVDVGGGAITDSIMKSMHIDKKRAEQFKKDIGFSAGQGNLPGVIEKAIEPIINEIKYSFDLYASQESDKKVEKIILTGGSAFLPNITDYLSDLLKIQVFIGDPWSRIIYPVELKPILDNLAPRFSVAVGLAMGELI